MESIKNILVKLNQDVTACLPMGAAGIATMKYRNIILEICPNIPAVIGFSAFLISVILSIYVTGEALAKIWKTRNTPIWFGFGTLMTIVVIALFMGGLLASAKALQ